MNIKFSINTLGCKTNQSESDRILRILLNMGMIFVSPEENPDLCIINTCVVTSQGESKSRQLIRKIKNLNPEAKILVTGCLSELGKKFLKDSGIDIVVDNKSKNLIPDLVSDIIYGKKSESAGAERRSQSKWKSGSTELHSRPLIKIQDGCQQNCSYCIVPLVRGKYKSIDPDEIIKEIIYFKDAGYEEVVLTGIHIGKYGIDFLQENGCSDSLEGLIKKILAETGIRRIRFSSTEVNELSESLLKTIFQNKLYFANHFHIPLQSGSNKILRLMNRPYNREFFLNNIEFIKELLPEFTLTTDVIVGFPGEDDNDFNDTLDIINKVGFSKLHIFRYSARPGTPANSMPGQIDGIIKSKRSAALNYNGKELRNNFLKENIGQILEVAVERKCEKYKYNPIEDKSVKDKYEFENEIFEGTSGNYIKVYFPKKGNILNTGYTGHIIKVKGLKLFKDGLFAEII